MQRGITRLNLSTKLLEELDNLKNINSSSNGIETYEDYSKLPTNDVKINFAYCKNDYTDNMDVNNPIVYYKGLYFYDLVNSKWSILPLAGLSEIKEALESLSFNKIDRYELDEYLDKDTYMSEINEGNVKCADAANKIKGTELAKPYQFFGLDGTGEAKFQYLPIRGDGGEVTQGNFEQRKIIDAKANDVYEIGSINGLDEYRIFVQAFKFKEGAKNIVSTVKEFNDSHKDSFYYNKENVDFVSDGCSIKNKYSFHVNLPKDGYFISNEINIDEFIK